jgi:hydrogenase expression/formation protein HypC
MCLAIPGLVLSIEESGDDVTRMAKVDFAGIQQEVSLAFTPEVQPGDYVLVHVGFALNRIDPEEAARTLEYLRQLGEVPDAGPNPSPESPA